MTEAASLQRPDDAQPTRLTFLGAPFDLIGQRAVLDELEASTERSPARYIVTPNADHVARLHRDPALKPLYDDAWRSLCDSKILLAMGRSRGVALEHVTGSDLTVLVFTHIVKAGDSVSMIVADDRVANDLATRYPHVHFRWHVPPAGLAQNPEAQRAAVDFVVREPARFIFIAVGSPQSELVARQFVTHAGAKGTALCIGASLEFLTGSRQRAPLWMQRAGLEWLHRVATDPRRLWRRYLFCVPPLARLYLREWIGNPAPR